MRFIVYTVFLSGWMFMWWWTYVYHIKDCGVNTGHSLVIVQDAEDKFQYPISFKWSDPTPVLATRFDTWRDSIVRSLDDDQILLITGLAYRDETGNSMTLGERRATAIAQLLEQDIPENRILKFSDIAPLTADVKNRNFPAYRLRTFTRNQYVQERVTCTLIYWPADTITQSGYQTILKYAQRLSVLLAGNDDILHVQLLAGNLDQSAERASSRTDLLQELLALAGIPPERISLDNNAEAIGVECMPRTDETELKDWILLMLK